MSAQAHILVVDDDRGIRDFLTFALTHHGYAVTTAENGQEGLQKYLGGTFDLVLTDIKMPVMDGVKMLSEIRQRTPAQKAIAMTGYAVEDKLDLLKDMNLVPLLEKPFTLEALLSLVQQVITSSSVGGEP